MEDDPRPLTVGQIYTLFDRNDKPTKAILREIYPCGPTCQVLAFEFVEGPHDGEFIGMHCYIEEPGNQEGEEWKK